MTVDEYCEETISEFETLTANAGRVQQETLRKILEMNGDADYLRRFGLRGRTDEESFRSCIPLCLHTDLHPFLQRIADHGDSTTPLLAAFSLSSGTSMGKPKYLMNWFRTHFKYAALLTYAFRNRKFPITKGKSLQFIYGSKQVVTKGGIVATTNLYRSRRHYKDGMKGIHSQCCSPDEVILCHLLCGLLSSGEVHSVFSTFGHSLVHAFQTLEEVWEDLCTDIRTGILSAERVTSSPIRAAVSKLLNPNPHLADSIYATCTGLSLSSDWYGVIPALWPNAKFVHGIMTGSMAPYVKKLRHYAGGLPLISADYGASEGWVGSNIDPSVPPEEVTYAVLPQIAYFEFIPLEKPASMAEIDGAAASVHYVESEPVGLTQVEVGKMYEVVITKFAGLYRYRLGDMVKIARFHNATPELQFVCRRSMVLSINTDKNTEKDLEVAVEAAAAKLSESSSAEKKKKKVEVVDFTRPSSSEPGRYVVFWELSSDEEGSEEVLSSCATAMDLAFVDAGYTGSRKVNTIGPLELRILSTGTFMEVLRHFLDLGGAVSQFKTPRFVNPSNVNLLHILTTNVTHTYFSTAYGS